ncbi:MAG TPA: trehalose-phosphatase, partial [Burkholderiales bacterium]|nr:trehalose-phosphatase [Burkholderiales bacterium]
HGWERLQPDGTATFEQPNEDERAALDRAADAIATLEQQGARVERKLASIALHWRGLEEHDAQSCRAAAMRAWSPYTDPGLLALLPFDGGLELRVPGCNKQHAVKAILAGTPPDAAIAYLGDDMTDEDAFRAIKARGISALVRAEFRPTAADVWLQPPGELVTFLAHWRVARR